jgi:hypothetical protein
MQLLFRLKLIFFFLLFLFSSSFFFPFRVQSKMLAGEAGRAAAAVPSAHGIKAVVPAAGDASTAEPASKAAAAAGNRARGRRRVRAVLPSGFISKMKLKRKSDLKKEREY